MAASAVLSNRNLNSGKRKTYVGDTLHMNNEKNYVNRFDKLAY
jgi:hypothetical protein